jgi:hypothetical protein
MTKIVSVNVSHGLGNQLFKIAAAYAYAIKEGGTLQIIRKNENGNRPVYWDSILLHMKPYLVESIPSTLSVWHDPICCTYSPIPSLTDNGMYLEGFYQSSHYFYNDDIKEKIRTLFSPSTLLFNEVYTRYSYLIDHADQVVVVHARRTDYTIDQNKIDTHGPLSADYYREGIKRMKIKVENPIWLLTSDDNRFWIDIEKDLDIHSPMILMNESDIYSLTLLQQFKNYIISNSTFIWWAAWMANAPNVIAPSKWFGPKGPSPYDDIYEPHWERI